MDTEDTVAGFVVVVEGCGDENGHAGRALANLVGEEARRATGREGGKDRGAY